MDQTGLWTINRIRISIHSMLQLQTLLKIKKSNASALKELNPNLIHVLDTYVFEKLYSVMNPFVDN